VVRPGQAGLISQFRRNTRRIGVAIVHLFAGYNKWRTIRRRPTNRSLNVLARGGTFRYRARERGCMVQRVSTVAFEGIEARAVDVQVQVAPGLPAFAIVWCQ
jgi:hypothetical protein